MSDPEGTPEGAVVIPVVAEQLLIDKREVVTGGIRIRKEVVERTETVDTALSVIRVQIEHVPIGRFVDTVPEVRTDGATTIIPVVEEVAVVQKRLWLREEVHVRRETVETREPSAIVLRHESVTIERLSADDAQALAAQERAVGTRDAKSPGEPDTPSGQPAKPVQ